MKTAEERITELEIKSAEQERSIAELSGELAEQWKVVERMQKRLEQLTHRFMALEEQAGPDVPVTRPPHY